MVQATPKPVDVSLDALDKLVLEYATALKVTPVTQLSAKTAKVCQNTLANVLCCRTGGAGAFELCHCLQLCAQQHLGRGARQDAADPEVCCASAPSGEGASSKHNRVTQHSTEQSSSVLLTKWRIPMQDQRLGFRLQKARFVSLLQQPSSDRDLKSIGVWCCVRRLCLILQRWHRDRSMRGTSLPGHDTNLAA